MWLWVPGAVGWAVSCITSLLAAAPTELLCVRGSLQPCCVAGFTWLHYSVDEEDSNYELESLWPPSPELDFSCFSSVFPYSCVAASTGIKICGSRLYQSQIFLLKCLLFFSLSFFIVLRPSDFKGINFLLKPGEKEATAVFFFFFCGLVFVFVFYHGALFHNLHLYITFTLASRLPGPLKIKINNCNLYQVSVPNRNSLQIRRLVLT